MISFDRCRHLLHAAPLLLLSAAPAADPVIPIAKARTTPVGTVVTVEGAVSTPSGAFASSFSDEGFGLQDSSAGLYVSLKDNPHLAPPVRVRVTGPVEDHAGLRVIVPAAAAAVKPVGRGPNIVPQPVKTAEIGEATEGRIVHVQGKITQAPASDAPYGFKFSVDDGSGEAVIFVNTQTRIAMDGLAAGKIVGVTGFSSQYDTHYEIDPRSPADISFRK
jgi:DNA/RNA endonuclease YhcR with UshA esterase domain